MTSRNDEPIGIDLGVNFIHESVFCFRGHHYDYASGERC